MKMKDERDEVIRYGRKLADAGLVTGTGGNVSLYDPATGLTAITPSGMDYHQLKTKDIPLLDLTGKTVDGKRKPSSEAELHLAFYRSRNDVRAVIHTHSTYCTVLATLRWDLPAANYYIALAGGRDVKCSRYATFGSKELADEAVASCEGRYAVLLANHGLVACSADLGSALTIAVETERMAEIYWRSKVAGTPFILDDGEVDKLAAKFAQYGQKQPLPDKKSGL